MEMKHYLVFKACHCYFLCLLFCYNQKKQPEAPRTAAWGSSRPQFLSTNKEQVTRSQKLGSAMCSWQRTGSCCPSWSMGLQDRLASAFPCSRGASSCLTLWEISFVACKKWGESKLDSLDTCCPVLALAPALSVISWWLVLPVCKMRVVVFTYLARWNDD